MKSHAAIKQVQLMVSDWLTGRQPFQASLSQLTVRCLHFFLCLTILTSSSPLVVLAYAPPAKNSLMADTEGEPLPFSDILPPSHPDIEPDHRMPASLPQNQLSVAPTLTITLTDSDIKLSWPDDPNATSFELYRATSPYFTLGSSTLLTTLPTGSTGYTDADAVSDSDAAFFYKLCALDDSDFLDSNEVGMINYILERFYSTFALHNEH